LIGRQAIAYEIDVLVMDRAADPAFVTQLRDRDIEVILAE
jgi:hypothetical protein